MFHKRWSRVLASALAGILLAGGMKAAGLMDLVDLRLYDGAARAYASTAGALPADQAKEAGAPLLVLVDQYSLTWAEQSLGLSWPWPREIYGVMAEFLSRAKAQAYDILFTETSPYGPEDDERCARAMDGAGNVVLAEARDAHTGARLSPLPAANVSYGSVRGLPDKDGVLRRYEIVRGSGQEAVPSLGFAALIRGGDASPGSKVPGPVPLRFRGRSPSFQAYNAAQVIQAALAFRAAKAGEPESAAGLRPEDFSGRYVFIGFSAPGLLDRMAVPTDSAMPGVEVHATFAADYVGEGLLRIANPWLLGLLQGVFLAAAAALGAWGAGLALLALGGIALLAAPIAIAYAAYFAGFAIPSGFFLLGGMFAYFTGIVLSYLAEGRNRRFLRRSFSQYLAPEVIDELVKDPSRLRLGGEERTITAFFSDIRDFTVLSEGMEPSKLAAFMNKYLSLMTTVILQEGGTVDKYVGDAVVAFWNAPLERPDHAARAVRAALACQKALGEAEGDFSALGVPCPFTRIGIHTGVAVVGNMGSPSRFNYTALGDVMNTASRLESANKTIGTRILVSGETAEACAGAEGVVLRRLGPIAVKGKAKTIEAWEARLPGEKNADPMVEGWEEPRSC